MISHQKYWILLPFLILFNQTTSRPLRNSYKNNIEQLIELIKRRNLLSSDEGILGVPETVEDLPRSEPVHPGHTLLQPAVGMLKSSVKFPHRDIAGTVYGNLNNLGITYGKTNQRVLYTDFRKANDLLYNLLKTLHSVETTPNKSKKPLVVIEIDSGLMKRKSDKRLGDDSEEATNKNNAMEILDDSDLSKETSSNFNARRKIKHKDVDDMLSSESDSEVYSSKSTDFERNPGNPYTVHKDKYKQNWLWNHFMDGNHMNVNPYAPQFSNMGPSGAALFFGRKWWYYNQDDFKPLN